MPIDLAALGESLRSGFGQIPPIAIALVLIAGPTAALVGYRMISASRRTPVVTDMEASPYWVCRDCRSVNELRLTRCYHCGLGQDATREIEVILDAPPARPTTFDVPAGSPFAAIGGNVDRARPPSTAGPGVPVMAESADWNTGVAVGPGHEMAAVAAPVVAENGGTLMLAETPRDGEPADATPTPALERQA